MQSLGKTLKVSIYFDEGSGRQGRDAVAGILDFLFHHNVSGAAAFKGVAGFGAEHRMHSESVLGISDHLPVKVEFVEDADRVEQLMPQLAALCSGAMIEVHETTVVKVPAKTAEA
jgi:PII-like signaling protein